MVGQNLERLAEHTALTPVCVWTTTWNVDTRRGVLVQGRDDGGLDNGGASGDGIGTGWGRNGQDLQMGGKEIKADS